MRRVRKHVHHAGGRPARNHARARECPHRAPGCPGDRRYTRRSCAPLRAISGSTSFAPCPRRVEQHPVVAVPRPRAASVHGAARSAAMELHVLDVVQFGVGARTLDEPSVALHADDPSGCAARAARRNCRGRRRDRAPLSVGAGARAARPRGSTIRALSSRVDLDEIGRLKLERHVELPASEYRSGVRVARQRGAPCPDRRAAGRSRTPARARTPPADRDPSRPGAASTRNTSAQPLSATAISICGTRSAIDSDCDQRRERIDQLADRRREHAALVKVGDVRCRALAKPDQHAAFLRDALDAESRAAAIAPGRRVERRQDLRSAPHRRSARGSRAAAACLNASCAAGDRCCKRAATADAEMRAARLDPLGARLDHGHEPASSKLRRRAVRCSVDPLPGQRVRYEHRLAVDARDTPAVVREIDDPRLLRRGMQALRSAHVRRPGVAKADRCDLSLASSQARTSRIRAACSSRVSRPRISSKRR